ncbi:MAG: hypothetical protein JWP12_232 [Bacteroidetes bacterium]|nr:hypothetical protein [Bacteroidota bacterium]
MKKLCFLFILLALKTNAKDVELKTTITAVTVFQSGAQVTRTGSVKIPPGESEIKISDATSLLKEESIQVKGEGNFTILSVNHQLKLGDAENEKTKWAELQAKQKSLMQQMEDLSVHIQVLNSQETAILNLKDISTATKGITVEQIGKAQELVHIKLMEIKTEKLKASRLILQLFDEHKTVTQHLLALKTPKQNVRYEIVIKVSAKTEVSGDFVVSYIVPNAHWYPTYDLRVKSVADPMTIEYKANVSQESGEDWNNIKLKLSTGDPSQSSEKPKLEAWWLYLNHAYVQPRAQTNFYRYTDARFTHVSGTIINTETGEPIPWCSVMVNGTHIGTTADGDGKFSMVLPQNGTQLMVSSIGYNAQTVTVNEKDLTVKLEKKETPINEVVKTDYEKELMTLEAPVFNTDYEGDLVKLDVDVNSPYTWGFSGGSGNGSVAAYGSSSYNVTIDADTKSGSTVTREEYQIMANKDKNTNMVTTTKTLNIVSTEFSIEEKYTIPSDPKNMTVAIQSIQTDAKYQYYCAPRLDKDVFLTAQLVNWEQYNFLEGQANVFFEGTFVGNTLFDTRYLVDTLEISLGRDKGIKVERKKSTDYNKSQLVGNDNIAYRDWDIVVRNAKQQAIDIIVEDQFPVSSDSKIVITQEEKAMVN